MKVFLNGQLEIDDVLPAKFGTSRDVSVSIRSDQFAPLQGNIGHLAILDRAISNQDAELLHAASDQLEGPEPVDILGLAMGVQDKNDPNNCKIHINGESRKLEKKSPEEYYRFTAGRMVVLLHSVKYPILKADVCSLQNGLPHPSILRPQG